MSKKDTFLRRQKRVRGHLKSGSVKPRLTVFRSNTHIYGQVIDDATGKTLISASDLKLSKTEVGKKTKVVVATIVGEKLSELLLKKKIKKVVFDRSGYKYHGRVKALADGARKGGLEF